MSAVKGRTSGNVVMLILVHFLLALTLGTSVAKMDWNLLIGYVE
jgi:hypothetical protein